MDKYEKFKQHIQEATQKFKKIPKNQIIRLISHLDADGISACSIMIKLLDNYNLKYSISIIQSLTREVLLQLKRESHKYFIFSDIGSNSLEDINEVLNDRNIFILDHHTPQKFENLNDNIVFVNPHLYDIDGGKEISGAGVVFLFAKNIDEELQDLAHVAVIGAIGDIQEEKGFSKLNKEILDIAVERGKIKLIKGLRIFGAQTKPLHKVLEYSTDPFIPDVTGSESGSIQFLQHIGINPKNGSSWKKLVHLTDEEIRKLVTGIIMKRLNYEDDPEDVLGNVYLLKEEKKESPTRDAKEFATLLNACGRMGKASLGIGTCLGDPKIKARAITNLTNYKKEIVNSLKWYEDNKNNDCIIKKEGYMILNAMDRVMPTIIGTLASILSKSNDITPGTYILSMAQLYDGNTKVSLRIAGRKQKVDLKVIVEEIISGLDNCEAGGHMAAAGAIIPTESEEIFIKKAGEILGKKALEEVVS